jgi:hypothetical protein
MVLAAPVAVLAASPTYNLGTSLNQPEIQSFDRPETAKAPFRAFSAMVRRYR